MGMANSNVAHFPTMRSNPNRASVPFNAGTVPCNPVRLVLKNACTFGSARSGRSSTPMSRNYSTERNRSLLRKSVSANGVSCGCGQTPPWHSKERRSLAAVEIRGVQGLKPLGERSVNESITRILPSGTPGIPMPNGLLLCLEHRLDSLGNSE